MKRTLWSLLVGITAVFPAVGMCDARASNPAMEPVATTVSPEAHRIEEQPSVTAEVRNDQDTEDAPARATTLAVVDAPAALIAPAMHAALPPAPDLAPITLQATGIPRARAP